MTATPEAHLFANLVESACSKVRLLRAFLQNQVMITCADPTLQIRAPMEIVGVLARAIVLDIGRIHRALEHGKQYHFVGNDERTRFLAALAPVLPVRHVNEHGADTHRKGGTEPIRASMHVHDNGTFALDETSLIVSGEAQIIMGPINLAETFPTLEELCGLAGYTAINPPMGHSPHF